METMAIVHNDIVRAIDNGDVSVLIPLDRSSAFDTIDHASQLDVLEERFGVKNIELEWIPSYFRAASQTSAPVRLTCSFPQVLMIVPQKFVAYTEIIEEVIEPFAIIPTCMQTSGSYKSTCASLQFKPSFRFWSGALQKSKTGARRGVSS